MPRGEVKSRASTAIWDSRHLRDAVRGARRDRRVRGDVRRERVDVEARSRGATGAQLQVGEAVTTVGEEVVRRHLVDRGRIERDAVELDVADPGAQGGARRV